MTQPKAGKWMTLFERFIVDLRISSKEETSEDKRGVKLVLWRSQSQFLTEVAAGLDDGVRIFNNLKGRQQGITSISLAVDVFWLAMHPNLKAALVTDSEKNRDANRDIIEGYIASFPQGYFGSDFTVVASNRKGLRFSNGSRLDFLIAGTRTAGGRAWGEGVGYGMAHETELGRYGDPEALASFEESLPQSNPNRLLIREGTANGYNHWRDKWLAGFADPFTARSWFTGWWACDTNVIERSNPLFIEYGAAGPSGAEAELINAVQKEYGWTVTREQLAWYRHKANQAWREGTDQMLVQNHPWTASQAFVQTGRSFFPIRQISNDFQTITDNPQDNLYKAYRYESATRFQDLKLVQITEESDRPLIQLKVWHEPVEGAKYAIGCDPAWGRTDYSDRHAISIWRCYADRLLQVAEFASADIEYHECAWILAHLAAAYEDCNVIIELQAAGRTIMMEWNQVKNWLNAEMNQRVVKDRNWENALNNARWYLYNRADSIGKGYARNFETTYRLKAEIMTQIKAAYLTGELMVHSKDLLGEMRNVVQKGTEIGAPPSYQADGKDDRVIAAALAVRAWIEWQRPSLMAQGATYEWVTASEERRTSTASNAVNAIVANWFATAEERNKPRPVPAWISDMSRGL